MYHNILLVEQRIRYRTVAIATLSCCVREIGRYSLQRDNRRGMTVGLSGPSVELVPGYGNFLTQRKVSFLGVKETPPWRPFVRPLAMVGR